MQIRLRALRKNRHDLGGQQVTATITTTVAISPRVRGTKPNSRLPP
jgi:hypothetical protein